MLSDHSYMKLPTNILRYILWMICYVQIGEQIKKEKSQLNTEDEVLNPSQNESTISNEENGMFVSHEINRL